MARVYEFVTYKWPLGWAAAGRAILPNNNYLPGPGVCLFVAPVTFVGLSILRWPASE